MKTKISPFVLAALLTCAPLFSWAADSKDGGSAAPASGSADQNDNNFYWQGTQLYNLGRLGEAFESFEKAIQRKQNSKEAEAYLIQIRQEIVTNAKKRSEERNTLNYGGGNNPENALNVVYLQKGFIRVTLQAKYLFDENIASLKSNSMDVINKLADILSAKEANNVELTMVDELDDTGVAKDIDAERALVVFSLVNFKKMSTDNANGAS
jgi:outer membrane protein OmpA-like peptidoglycan-associated protein